MADAEDLLFLRTPFARRCRRDSRRAFRIRSETVREAPASRRRGAARRRDNRRAPAGWEQDSQLAGDDRTRDRFLPVLPHRRIGALRSAAPAATGRAPAAERLDAQNEGGPLDRRDRPGKRVDGGVDGLEELSAQAGVLLEQASDLGDGAVGFAGLVDDLKGQGRRRRQARVFENLLEQVLAIRQRFGLRGGRGFRSLGRQFYSPGTKRCTETVAHERSDVKTRRLRKR